MWEIFSYGKYNVLVRRAWIIQVSERLVGTHNQLAFIISMIFI